MKCPECGHDLVSTNDVKAKPKEAIVTYLCRHCTAKWRKVYSDPEIEIIEEGH
jgi:transcription elongation factor Elf1